MSANYKFRDLKIYGSTEWLSENTKRYRRVFDRYETTYIYAEFSFFNKRFDEADWNIDIMLKCFSGSKEICTLNFENHIVKKEDPICYIREGWGHTDKGSFWVQGRYYWEVWLNSKKIKTQYFYIEDAGKPYTEEENPYLEIKSLKLYEGGYDDVKKDQRKYVNRFVAAETRYVFVEVIFKNKHLNQNWQCEFISKFYTEGYQLKGEIIRLTPVSKKNELIEVTMGWGSDNKGTWLKGKYNGKLIFMDSLLAGFDFSVVEHLDTELLPGIELRTGKSQVQEERLVIRLNQVPENLNTALQQYILFYRDFVKQAKGKDIRFSIKNNDQGFSLIAQNEEELNIIRQYFKEYLSFAKTEHIESIETETDLSEQSADLLKMRLEQQIHHLNMALKYQELQSMLKKEQKPDHEFGKSSLLKTLLEAVYPKTNLLQDNANS